MTLHYRRSRFAALMLVVLALLVFLAGCQRKAIRYRSKDQVDPREREGRITFDVTIPVPAGAQMARLWLPYPTSNEYQTIEHVEVAGNSSDTAVYRDPESGNLSLYAEWQHPTEQPRLTLSLQVRREEMLRKDFPEREAPVPENMARYLLPTELGPVTGGVKELADEITKGEKTVLGKAEAIYDYIVENAQRDSTIVGCGIGDVRALLQNPSGKCVDLTSIFVALARSVGVPSREILGIRMAKEGDITGAYHCRGEFYLPGYGWVPVDPSDVRKVILNENLDLADPKVEEARDYYFGAQSETYVDLGSGRDVTLSPVQDGGKLNYFMYPYAEVDGRVLDWLGQEELVYSVTLE